MKLQLTSAVDRAYFTIRVMIRIFEEIFWKAAFSIPDPRKIDQPHTVALLLEVTRVVCRKKNGKNVQSDQGVSRHKK